MPAKKKAPAQPPKKASTKAASKPKAQAIDRAVKKEEEPYHLPRGCALEAVESDIRNYGVFEFEDAVYSVYDYNGNKTKFARQVANFTCRIEAHIALPEGTALKLITIRNIYKEEFTYHVGGDALLTLPQFRKITDGDKGNFDFNGTDLAYRNYYRMMKDNMGRGRIIREMGIQPEGFFVYCNAVIFPDGTVEMIDEQGCFTWEDNRFYVPAAKATMRGAFSNSRRVEYVESDITFGLLSSQLRKVHREHSYMALVFAVATIFRDIIKKRLGGFVILFYYGETGAGKDDCIDTCRTLYGIPQDPLQLTGSNTGPGSVNMFAEMICIPQCLSEWKNDMKMEMQETVFGLWQGMGRRRGTKNIDVSPYATDAVPIDCTVYCTGNDYPNVEDKGMTRFIIDEVDKTSFTAEETSEFLKLGEMRATGYSYLLKYIVPHRKHFEETWLQGPFKEAQAILRDAITEKSVSGRTIQNAATLLCVYIYFERKLEWAFTRAELVAHMAKCIDRQHRNRGEGSPVSEFWTCFIAAKRKGDIQEDVHYRIEGDIITFFWEEMYTIYEQTYRSLGRKKAPLNNTTMLGKLKKHPCYKESIATHSIGGRKNRAQAFDMNATGTHLKGLLVTDIPADRYLGDHQGEPVQVKWGTRGPYIKAGKITMNVPKGVDPLALTLIGAVSLITKAQKEQPGLTDDALPF